PSLTVVLETKDGGNSWQVNISSLFGRMSDVSIRNGRAVSLVEFDNYFKYPSEVYCSDIGTGKLERCLRRTDFAVTDIEVLPGGQILAVGFQPQGLLARTPIPGKLRIMSSADGKNWRDAAVDYRAVANRVALAALDAEHIWAATDTGMILRFRPEVGPVR